MRLGLFVAGGLYVRPEAQDASSTRATMTFEGWVAPGDVRAAIANTTDVLVHSNVLEETFCMCNVEAMAEGVPVVTFGVGGVSEYLARGDGHGVVVAAASVPGQEKGAKFPTSKAPISVVFHSFRLVFGRVIISRNGLERERLSLERARAERPR